MKNHFEYTVFNKILENSAVLLETFVDNSIRFPSTAIITATTYSTAITLDLLFQNEDYNNFDIDLLLEMISSNIESYRKTIYDGSHQDNFFQDNFFREQMDISLEYFKKLKYNKDLVLKDIKPLTKELIITKSAFFANQGNSGKKIESIFPYNAFINFLIFPLINSLENQEEKIKLIREKLDSNDNFVNSKNKFIILLNKTNATIIRNHSEETFLMAVKEFKGIPITNIKNQNTNSNTAPLIKRDNEPIDLIKKIDNFIEDYELKTMSIHFLELSATLFQGKNSSYLNKQLPKYEIYVTKQSLFGTVSFWFIDGGKIIFCMVTSLSNLNKDKISNSINIEIFQSLDADTVRGKKIQINNNSIVVNAILKDNKNLFDVKYIEHYYDGLINVTYSKTLIDIEKIINQKLSNQNCYIATLVYEDINHPKVELLRQFRDKELLNTFWGKPLVRLYYFISPSLVRILKPFKKIQIFIRIILDRLITNIS